jgi:predicted TIM-barrel fold metal-dependent hydrolase
MIIDCHQHLPRLQDGKTFEHSREILLQELGKNNVDYAILIPDNKPVSTIGNLNQVLEVTKDCHRLFVMGTVDIQRKMQTQLEELDALLQNGKIFGIKIFPGLDPIYPTDKRLSPVSDLCIKYDTPIVVHTGGTEKNPKAAKYNDPKHIVKVADKFPDLKIVIAHCFFPRVEYCHELTKQYEKIYFDTSALADDSVVEMTGIDRIRKVLTSTVIEHPSNVVFGTDYAMCDIRKHIAFIDSLDIEDELKSKVLSQNAIRLFNLPLQ